MKLKSLVLVAAIGLSPALAFAQGGQGGGGPQGPCAADIQKLCGDKATGGREAVRACLAEKRDQLSPACKERLAQVQQGGGAGGAQAPKQ